MSLADAAITIPTAEFPSLNLGQAVLLIGYEWLKSADATPRQPTAQNRRRAGATRRTGGTVRASGARIGRSPVPLSAGEERDDGAQHARHDPALASERPGSAHHPRHDRGAGEETNIGANKREGDSCHRAGRGRASGDRLRRPAGVARTSAQGPRAFWPAPSRLLLLGVGGGTYWMLGQPYLAWRSAQGVQTRDVNGLIALLIKRVRQAPDDMQAWIYLGRGYMAAGDRAPSRQGLCPRRGARQSQPAIPMPAWIRCMAKPGGRRQRPGERRSGSGLPRRA